MVTSQEMPIYHPNSQDELAGIRPQQGQPKSSDYDVSIADDAGQAPAKLPSNAIPKFEYLDKFEKPNANRDREGNSDNQEGFNGSRNAKASKKRVKQDEAADYYRATPRTLSATLFPVLDGMTTLVADTDDEELEELELSLDDAFKQWNDSFKADHQVKRRPPSISPIKPTYIRQEFQVNRSPHLWKSDPKKMGILTFGPLKALNNKVNEILFKYQNNTIDAKA